MRTKDVSATSDEELGEDEASQGSCKTSTLEIESIEHFTTCTGMEAVVLIKLMSKVHCFTNTTEKYNIILNMYTHGSPFLFQIVPDLIQNKIQEDSPEFDVLDTFMDYLVFLKKSLRYLDWAADNVEEVLPRLQKIVESMKISGKCDMAGVNWEIDHIEKILAERKKRLGSDTNDVLQERTNFREMSVIPKQSDVVRAPKPYLPMNIVDGPYKNVEQYLDVHFRLLREDMLRSFRTGIRNFRKRLLKSDKEISNGRLFTNIKVGYPPEYCPEGILYKVVVHCATILLTTSKCLSPGSLVCFTPNNFLSVTFATVRNAVIESEERVQLTVFVDSEKDELSHKIPYILFQNDIYFEAYKHTLYAIKEFDEQNLPLSEVLVYLKCQEAKLKDSQSCSSQDTETQQTSFDLQKWVLEKDLAFDDTQIEAFQLALTEKVALIQGPPGTGKTHLASEIVRVLLDKSKDAPIVICTVTNQALDKFLTLLLRFTSKMVRLGLQSNNDGMQPYVLKNLRGAIQAFKEHGENAEHGLTPVMLQALEIAKDIYPELKSIPTKGGHNGGHHHHQSLRSTCWEINKLFMSYADCKWNYLEDRILKQIVSPVHKEQILAGAGSNARQLSKCLAEWLLLDRSPVSGYEQCEDAWIEIAVKKQKCQPQMEDKDVEVEVKVGNVWRIPVEERFALFYQWRKHFLKILRGRLKEKKQRYDRLRAAFGKPGKPIQVDTVALLKKAKIIGVTTCGAAKFKDVIKAASPKILVMEEAAEVLESHAIASLVPSIEQLVLIGDHEQLRPVSSVYQLAKHYNIRVSMFERLVKNGAKSVTLTTQYRMRPTMVKLLVPQIYTQLKSHPQVIKYENVRGVAKNIYFFNHDRDEDPQCSYRVSSNKYEAKFIANLCEYLLLQGYAQSQITILAAYKGQVLQILDHICFEITDLLVTTIDGYQGEENDIVLVSFVRSNEENKIGFLYESNRVCVALSRARKGLYCVGNFDMFGEKNRLWNSVRRKLQEVHCIGTEFPLQCRNHWANICHVRDSEDFLEYALDGCGWQCEYTLPCGHICAKLCHFDDPLHEEYICQMPCNKMVTHNGESTPCSKLCCEKCKEPQIVELECGHEVTCEENDIDSFKKNYRCEVEIRKLLPCGHYGYVPCHAEVTTSACEALMPCRLPCGHTMMLPCHALMTSYVLCEVIVHRVASCGHTVEVPCCKSKDHELIRASCNHPCDTVLNCGHLCPGTCYQCARFNIHALCSQPCKRLLQCGHECEGICNVPCGPCNRPCEMNCNHTTCENLCNRPCIKCTKLCDRQCPHKSCDKQCWQTCQPCREPCDKLLVCGHPCIGFCGHPCPDLCRFCHRLDCRNPQSDRFVMLENCHHAFEVEELEIHVEASVTSAEWPLCPACKTPIRYSTHFSGPLKEAKDSLLSILDPREELANVSEQLQRLQSEVAKSNIRFKTIYQKIVAIVRDERPGIGELYILGQCLLAINSLLKLHYHLNGRSRKCITQLHAYLDWIEDHLRNLNYQQIKELHISIKCFRKEVRQEMKEAKDMCYGYDEMTIPNDIAQLGMED